MPQESSQTGRDSAAAAEPVIGWGFGSAGWSVAYSGAAPIHPASDEDPEAIAMRLWSEGRRDEALAFLEGRIARERSQADNSGPAGAGSRAETGGALVLVPSPSTEVQAVRPVEFIAPEAGLPAAAQTAGKLIHIAPEPRIGDAGRIRRTGAMGARARPRWIMAAALLAGSVGAGAAFWPGSDRGPVEVAEPADPIAANVGEPPGEVAALRPALSADRTEAVQDSSAPVDLPGASAIRRQPREPVPPPAAAVVDEPAVVESAPAAVPAEAAPPAEVEAAPRPVVTAGTEPETAVAPPQIAERAVATARLPNPRPRLARPWSGPQTYQEPEELAAAIDNQPPGPEDEHYPPEADADYLPDAGYGDLPPVLAQRRAAAARYAARRRAAADRMDDPRRRVIVREAPVFTIEGPVILRAARGLP